MVSSGFRGLATHRSRQPSTSHRPNSSKALTLLTSPLVLHRNATLACTSLANELGANSHALFDSFEQAWKIVDDGFFNDCEPGPYRIFAVYSVAWAE